MKVSKMKEAQTRRVLAIDIMLGYMHPSIHSYIHPYLKPPRPLCLPTASISSIKMIQGAFALASLNKSRTGYGIDGWIDR